MAQIIVFLPSFVAVCMLNGVVIIIQGIFTIIKNLQSSMTRWWFSLSVVVGGWCFLYGLLVVAPNNLVASQYLYWSFVLALMIPPIYVGFALSLLDDRRKYLPLLHFSTLITLVNEFLLVFGLLIEVSVFSPFHYYWSAKAAYFLVLINANIPPAFIVIVVLLTLKNVGGRKRNQLSYFAFASIAGWGTGNFIHFPAIGIPIIPYTMYLFWVYPLIITYSIIKHRLMDITVVIRKSLIYSLTIGVITAFLLIGVFLVTQYFSSKMGAGSITISVLLLALAGLGIQPLRGVIERIVDRVFFRRQYEYSKALRQMIGLFASDDTKPRLASALQTIQDVVGTNHAALFLRDSSGGELQCFREISA